MILYNPFWHTLKNSDETTYTLIQKHHLSSATLDKLRKNKPITTTTINDLCRILNCNVENIMTYIPSETDQKL
ncbi:MAG: helix-turn-helix transcriptional regulator [Anaerobutyricum sp.]|nr:helix-turn-helix transcriptional regulator [Anaerobutyricum sp.]